MIIKAFRRIDKTKLVGPELYFFVKIPCALLRPKIWSLASQYSHCGCYLPMQEQSKGRGCSLKQ